MLSSRLSATIIVLLLAFANCQDAGLKARRMLRGGKGKKAHSHGYYSYYYAPKKKVKLKGKAASRSKGKGSFDSPAKSKGKGGKKGGSEYSYYDISYYSYAPAKSKGKGGKKGKSSYYSYYSYAPAKSKGKGGKKGGSEYSYYDTSYYSYAPAKSKGKGGKKDKYYKDYPSYYDVSYYYYYNYHHHPNYHNYHNYHKIGCCHHPSCHRTVSINPEMIYWVIVFFYLLCMVGTGAMLRCWKQKEVQAQEVLSKPSQQTQHRGRDSSAAFKYRDETTDNGFSIAGDISPRDYVLC